MCGLCGVAGDIKKDDVDVFNDLLLVSSLRGRDSTGIARVSRSRKPEDILWLKDVGDPFHLRENLAYGRVADHPALVLMGHTRFATIGKSNRQNAHPFVSEPIIGMHNGTITRYPLQELLRREGHKVPEFGTDSELLIHCIATLGVEQTIKHCEGAYAIVWWNWEDNTLNMIRNSERDIYYCFDEKERVMMWASEPNFLYACTNRPFYHRVIKLSEEKVRLLPVNQWMKWAVPNKWQDEFPDAVRKEIRGLGPVKVQYKDAKAWVNSAKDSASAFAEGGGGEGAPWYGTKPKDNDRGSSGNGTVLHFPERGTGVDRQRTLEEIAADVVRGVNKPAAIPPERMAQFAEAAENLKKKAIIRQGKRAKWFKGWNGQAMDRDDYLLSTSKGCAWCTSQADWPEGGDPDVVRFVSRDEYLCGVCMKDNEVLATCGLTKAV